MIKSLIQRQGTDAAGYFAITNKGAYNQDYLIAIPPDWGTFEAEEQHYSDALEAFINYYSPQVKVYSRFWEEMSGEKVIKAGLYFIHTKQFVPVVI